MPKKMLLFVLMITLALITACSTNHENHKDKNNNNNENVESSANNEEIEGSALDPEAEEIFSKMIEAAEPINNYANYEEENETIENDEQSWPASLTKERYMITDKPAFYEKMTVIIPSLISEQEDVETYLTEEGYFQYGAESEQWYKYDDSTVDIVKEEIKVRSNLQAIVEDLINLANVFDLDEDEDFYYFSLHYDKADIEEDAEELSEIFDVEAMKELNVYKVFYEVKVDKSTYLISSMTDTKAFTHETKNDTLDIEKEVIIEFDLFNEVKDIELPKEALEEAEEVDM